MNGKDIHDELLSQGYSDDFIKELYEREIDERLILQEQQNKQAKKVYNNEALENTIYESFLKYPIRKVPFKDRPSVLLSKMIGIVKRKYLNRNTKLLPEPTSSSYEEHVHFVSEIANLEAYKGNEIIAQNANEKVIRQNANNIENSR